MQNPQSDIIIQTSDKKLFYAHRHVLGRRSTNNFANLVPGVNYPSPGSDHKGISGSAGVWGLQPSSPQEYASTPYTTIHVSEVSLVFNVIIHFAYNMSCEPYQPDLNTLQGFFESLSKYGLPRVTTMDQSEIPAALMRHVSTSPIRVYALAAENSIDSVCVLASQYTLDVTLDQVSEADALTMGPIYLRRLYFLHIGRLDALRRLTTILPSGHRPSSGCSANAQRAVMEAWKAGVGRVMMNTRAHNTSTPGLVSAFEPATSATTCLYCRESVQMRIADLVDSWATVRRTI